MILFVPFCTTIRTFVSPFVPIGFFISTRYTDESFGKGFPFILQASSTKGKTSLRDTLKTE